LIFLLDINLGLGMDGLAATLYEIRKVPGYQSIPVVAFTAYVLHGDRGISSRTVDVMII
jgi:CheY-like chemotaxis protein